MSYNNNNDDNNTADVIPPFPPSYTDLQLSRMTEEELIDVHDVNSIQGIDNHNVERAINARVASNAQTFNLREAHSVMLQCAHDVTMATDENMEKAVQDALVSVMNYYEKITDYNPRAYEDFYYHTTPPNFD